MLVRNSKSLITSVLLLLALIFGNYVIAAENDDGINTLKLLSKGFATVGKAASPAVVSVKAVAPENSSRHLSPFREEDPFGSFGQEFFHHFFGFPPGNKNNQPNANVERQPVFRGSGFIISPDGYVITNNHVIRNVDNIIVLLDSGEEYTAELVGADPMADVAVLKIDSTDLPHLKFGDSDKLEIGEWVIAIGTPLEFEASLTVGVVSAKGRDNLSINALEDFIQTDAAINPGNSGGPLLNLDKKVIGINSAIATTSGGYMGIGFAIPSNMAKHITEQIISTGNVTHGFLGIVPQPVTKDLAKSFDLEKPEGTLIAEVLEGHAAEKAGLKAGDIILKYNDTHVKNLNNLINGIAMMKPGTEITLTIFRDGETIEVPVTVGSRPDDHAQREHVEDQLGFEVDDLNEELRHQFGYEDEKGVIVTDVTLGSPATAIGLRPGTLILSINRQNVNSANEFYAALKEANTSKSGRILLLTKYDKVMRFVTLPIKKKNK